jgi:hypothetical protein
VGEIAKAFSISAAAAGARLQALGTVPTADLLFLSTNAQPVQDAAAKLTALGAVPPADLQKAVKDAPGQWQR